MNINKIPVDICFYFELTTNKPLNNVFKMFTDY